MSTQTQIESWHKTLSELGPRQREVLNALLVHPRSAWELSKECGRMVHAVRPRLTELKAKGMIREAGERYEPITDRNEAVWEVVLPGEGDQLEMAI
jgi:predicted transcriptional regulator